TLSAFNEKLPGVGEAYACRASVEEFAPLPEVVFEHRDCLRYCRGGHSEFSRSCGELRMLCCFEEYLNLAEIEVRFNLFGDHVTVALLLLRADTRVLDGGFIVHKLCRLFHERLSRGGEC